MNRPQNVVPTEAPVVKSFGKGGQSYIANLYAGFVISAEQINELFSFTQNDTSVNFARVLTNLVEARKIGSTMSFTAGQMTIRAFKLGNTVATAQELHDLKKLLASSRVEVNVGSNETKIAEFTGAHFMNIQDTVAAAGAGALVSEGTQNASGWCALPLPIALQPAVNIGGSVRFGIPVPASLRAADEEWAFLVVLAGEKNTK